MSTNKGLSAEMESKRIWTWLCFKIEAIRFGSASWLVWKSKVMVVGASIWNHLPYWILSPTNLSTFTLEKPSLLLLKSPLSSTAVFQWEQRLWDVFGSEIDTTSLRFWREEYNPPWMGNTENTSLCSNVSNLCDAMNCSLPGFSVHGIFQAGILEQVAISYSRGSSLTQRSNPCLLCLLHCRQIPRG